MSNLKNSEGSDKTVQYLASWVKSFTDWRSMVNSDIEKIRKANIETDADLGEINRHIEELYRRIRLNEESISKLYRRNKIVLILALSVFLLTFLGWLFHLIK